MPDRKKNTSELGTLQKNLKHREREIFSILKIGKALSSTLKLDELLNLIMNEITDLMNAERSTLYLVDKERGEIWSKIALKAEVKEIRQKIGRGISGYVAQTGEIINIPDAYRDSRFDPTTDKKTGYRTRSILCMPIWEPLSRGDGREIMGVVQVLNKKDGVFTSEDEELLETLSAQVAISIANSRLYHQLEKKYRELDLLYEFEQLLSEIYDLPTLIEKILVKTNQYLKANWILALLPFRTELQLFGVPEKLTPVLQAKSTLSETDIINQILRLNASDLRARLLDWFPELKLHWSDTSTLLFSPVALPEEKNGILIAVDIQQGDQPDLSDERKLLDQVIQKMTRAIELFNLRQSLIQQERMSAIGKMMSTIVHDIRGPVNTIYGFVDLMSDASATPDERQDYASVIRDEIRSLMNMITEILDFAKGKSTILPRKTSVPNIIKKIQPQLEQLCQKNGIRLQIDVRSRDLLYVDEGKLNRAIYNISKNAVEAMGQNGGKLLVAARSKNGEVEFEITDTGPGIPTEIKEKIFETFVTSGKTGGTGLGLAIVKKVIDEHGGTMEIQSKPGEGATFFIRLPKYKEEK